MLEYIEQLLHKGVHFASAPKRNNKGNYELVITSLDPNMEICIRMEKTGVEKLVTEFRMTEVLKLVGKTDKGEKKYQTLELPTGMFRKTLKFKRDMNAFSTPGVLSF